MTDRRLPADHRSRTDRQSKRWLWLLVFVVLLAAWYWFQPPAGERAPAPPVGIESSARDVTEIDRIDRPAREPRHLERPGSDRHDGGDDARGTPAEPPVPLSPRS